MCVKSVPLVTEHIESQGSAASSRTTQGPDHNSIWISKDDRGLERPTVGMVG